MRETTICFRTSDDLRKGLEKISKDQRRSLSSLVEGVLYAYVKKRPPQEGEQEKRRDPRKTLSVPGIATIRDGVQHAIVVQDVSAGGIFVSAPRDFCEEAADSEMLVLFALPDTDKPLAMRYRAGSIRSNGHGTGIGATLVEADFPSCQRLQNYLTT